MKINKECMSIGVITFVITFLFLINYSTAQTCRTPGGNRVVLFEPVAYFQGEVTLTSCSTAVEKHNYIVQQFIQLENPCLSPNVTLLDYIEIMQYPDLGIFAFVTHGNSLMISIVVYKKDRLFIYFVWNSQTFKQGFDVMVPCLKFASELSLSLLPRICAS